MAASLRPMESQRPMAAAAAERKEAAAARTLAERNAARAKAQASGRAKLELDRHDAYQVYTEYKREQAHLDRLIDDVVVGSEAAGLELQRRARLRVRTANEAARQDSLLAAEAERERVRRREKAADLLRKFEEYDSLPGADVRRPQEQRQSVAKPLAPTSAGKRHTFGQQVRSSPSGTMPHHMLDAVAGQPMKTRVRPNFKLPRQQSHPFRQQPMYAQQLAPERGSEDGKVGDGGDRPETIDKEGESIAQCVDGGSDGSKECGNGGCGGGGGGGGGDGSDGSDGGGGCGQEKGGGGAGGQASRGRCPSSAAEAWITAAPSRRAAPATTATRTQRSPKRPPPFIAHDKAPGHVFSRTPRASPSGTFAYQRPHAVPGRVPPRAASQPPDRRAQRPKGLCSKPAAAARAAVTAAATPTAAAAAMAVPASTSPPRAPSADRPPEPRARSVRAHRARALSARDAAHRAEQKAHAACRAFSRDSKGDVAYRRPAAVPRPTPPRQTVQPAFLATDLCVECCGDPFDGYCCRRHHPEDEVVCCERHKAQGDAARETVARRVAAERAAARRGPHAFAESDDSYATYDSHASDVSNVSDAAVARGLGEGSLLRQFERSCSLTASGPVSVAEGSGEWAWARSAEMRREHEVAKSRSAIDEAYLDDGDPVVGEELQSHGSSLHASWGPARELDDEIDSIDL